MATGSPEEPLKDTVQVANGNDTQETVLRRHVPPFLSKFMYASSLYGLQSILGPVLWLREWRESRNPPEGRPDLVKTYECRPSLPVR